MSTSNTVHKLPPKSFIVRYRGLHGTVTFNPATKKWDWKVNMLTPMSLDGTEPDEKRAREAVEKVLKSAATGNRVKTVD